MVLASRGLRETGQGVEPIADPAVRDRLRARGRAVGRRALAATLVVMALALALPAAD